MFKGTITKEQAEELTKDLKPHKRKEKRKMFERRTKEEVKRQKEISELKKRLYDLEEEEEMQKTVNYMTWNKKEWNEAKNKLSKGIRLTNVGTWRHLDFKLNGRGVPKIVSKGHSYGPDEKVPIINLGGETVTIPAVDYLWCHMAITGKIDFLMLHFFRGQGSFNIRPKRFYEETEYYKKVV